MPFKCPDLADKNNFFCSEYKISQEFIDRTTGAPTYKARCPRGHIVLIGKFDFETAKEREKKFVEQYLDYLKNGGAEIPSRESYVKRAYGKDNFGRYSEGEKFLGIAKKEGDLPKIEREFKAGVTPIMNDLKAGRITKERALELRKELREQIANKQALEIFKKEAKETRDDYASGRIDRAEATRRLKQLNKSLSEKKLKSEGVIKLEKIEKNKKLQLLKYKEGKPFWKWAVAPLIWLMVGLIVSTAIGSYLFFFASVAFAGNVLIREPENIVLKRLNKIKDKYNKKLADAKSEEEKKDILKAMGNDLQIQKIAADVEKKNLLTEQDFKNHWQSIVKNILKLAGFVLVAFAFLNSALPLAGFIGIIASFVAYFYLGGGSHGKQNLAGE